jgi:hypothetical protein
MKSSDSVHVWATLRNITLDLIMHCTYHFPCGLSFRFQISLSIAAMALSYSCHNMNLFWLKAVGLQFIPRNDNHNVQILIWFGRPIWNKPCFTSTTFKDNGMMLLRHTVVDTPQCFFSFVFIILLSLEIDLHVLCPFIISIMLLFQDFWARWPCSSRC